MVATRMQSVDFGGLCYNEATALEWSENMVVTAATETTQQTLGGIRPMDPTQDLGTIAELIADCFADDLDERGRAALREMRLMARLSPLVWWLSQTDPTFSHSFNGLVWEEPAAEEKTPFSRSRQIVGNVSLNRAPGSRQRWIVCNVAVRADYRGLGIGRRLTMAAVDEAMALGAEGVLIQVHEDNQPALELYTSLGFQKAEGETELRLKDILYVTPSESPGYQFRPWRPTDGAAVHEIASLATPAVQQWIRPVRAGKYQPGWWAQLTERLSGVLAGRRVYRLTVLKEDRPVAMMALAVSPGRGEYRLELLVHPTHAGQVETALVSRALHMLAAAPPKPVRVTAEQSHAATLQALGEFGFEEGRTLLTLRKDLA